MAIRMEKDSELYKMLDKVARQFEKQFDAEVLFSGLGRSYPLQINNKSSDYDSYIVFRKPNYDLQWQGVTRGKINDIDLGCKDINLVEQFISSRVNVKYPSFNFSEKAALRAVTDCDSPGDWGLKAPDNSGVFIFRLLHGRHVWDGNGYLDANWKEIRKFMRTLEILDFYFWVSKEKWLYYLNRPQIYVRKCLYTLHEVFTMQWIAKHNTIPPAKFMDLLHCCTDKNFVNEAEVLYNKNKDSTNKRDLLFDYSPVISDYINDELYKLEKKIEEISISSPELLIDESFGCEL